MARGLSKGFDISGNKLEHGIDMALGAVVNPNFDPIELQLMKMKKKSMPVPSFPDPGSL